MLRTTNNSASKESQRRSAKAGRTTPSKDQLQSRKGRSQIKLPEPQRRSYLRILKAHPNRYAKGIAIGTKRTTTSVTTGAKAPANNNKTHTRCVVKDNRLHVAKERVTESPGFRPCTSTRRVAKGNYAGRKGKSHNKSGLRPLQRLKRGTARSAAGRSKTPRQKRSYLAKTRRGKAL